MELENFIENFAEIFDMVDVGDINSQTVIKGINGWSSLSILLVMEMIDEKYNVIIRGNEIRNCKTIEDLFNIVKDNM
jgi:acyl carrier protein